MIGLLLAECKLNCGLDVLDIQPSFITARKGDRIITMRFCVTEYYKEGEDYYIDITPANHSDYTIVFFYNKKSNNVAMFDSKELGVGKKSLSALSNIIKKKWEWEVN